MSLVDTVQRDLNTANAALTPAERCPDWCTAIAPAHADELETAGCVFHVSGDLDSWRLDYEHADADLSVRTEVYSSRGHSDVPLVVVDGTLSRGSNDLAELTPADARRLAAALLSACDQIEGSVSASDACADRQVFRTEHLAQATDSAREAGSR